MKTPENFRAPDPLPAPQATSLADLKWWEVCKDEKLQERRALSGRARREVTAQLLLS